jgi:hypothetical protein
VSRRARHLEAPRAPGEGLDSHRAVCGARVPISELVHLPVDATCRQCLKSARSPNGAYRRAQAGEYLRALVEHTREGMGEPVVTPWVPGPPGPVMRGTTDLGRHERAVLARSQRGDSDMRGPRWSSLKAAVQRWAAHVDEGSPINASSVYRFTADSAGTAKGTREGRVSNVERAVDDIVSTDRVLRRMFPEGVTWGDIALPPELCREIFVQRHAGRPLYSGPRRECIRRIEVDMHHLIELACKVACGCGMPAAEDGVGRCVTVTSRHIALVVKRGNEQLMAALVATGEMSERRTG